VINVGFSTDIGRWGNNFGLSTALGVVGSMLDCQLVL
jgi:hypothetical protein